MRKVMVRENYRTDSKEIGVARFHQFGSAYEESSAGFGNYTTAVIEWPDGRVENIPVERVQFIEPTGRDLVGELCEFSDDGETWAVPGVCTNYAEGGRFPYGTATNAFRFARAAGQVKP